MVRWWNVTDVSPSGLRLNRAWYIRQFLVALIPPACAFILFESVSRWEASKNESNKQDQTGARVGDVLIDDSSKTSSESKCIDQILENLPKEHQIKAKKIHAVIEEKREAMQLEINTKLRQVKDDVGWDDAVDALNTRINMITEIIHNALQPFSNNRREDDAHTDTGTQQTQKCENGVEKKLETPSSVEIDESGSSSDESKMSSMRRRRNSNKKTEPSK